MLFPKYSKEVECRASDWIHILRADGTAFLIHAYWILSASALFNLINEKGYDLTLYQKEFAPPLEEEDVLPEMGWAAKSMNCESNVQENIWEALDDLLKAWHHKNKKPNPSIIQQALRQVAREEAMCDCP